MNLTYAIPDLHGRADLLDRALDAMSVHALDGAAGRTAVFLGDYVDRGRDSRSVLDRLMAGPPAGWRWVCLKGNHEQMMVDACRGVDDPAIWMTNGAHATLRCFALDWREIEPFELPALYVDWAAGLALTHLDRHRIYVHAGLDRTLPLDQQREDDLLWRRDPDPEGYRGRHIVHGHTAKRDGPELMDGRTNLDTLAWKTGRLVIGVFDDQCAGGPRELLEVRHDG